MGHSQADKARTRERILAEAARQIRAEGLEAVSVGPLMKRVGLTHGGFYGHFESRSQLLAEALERALQDGAARAKGGAGQGFDAAVRAYLSRAHRDAPDSGCALAALVSDIGRGDPASRQATGAHLEAFIDRFAALMDGDRTRALAAVSTMVGALSLARVAPDKVLSDAILKSARDAVLDMGRPRAGQDG